MLWNWYQYSTKTEPVQNKGFGKFSSYFNTIAQIHLADRFGLVPGGFSPGPLVHLNSCANGPSYKNAVQMTHWAGWRHTYMPSKESKRLRTLKCYSEWQNNQWGFRNSHGSKHMPAKSQSCKYCSGVNTKLGRQLMIPFYLTYQDMIRWSESSVGLNLSPTSMITRLIRSYFACAGV